jgi:hypothetical protein
LETNNPPYTFTHSYADGQYLIEAVATDITGLRDSKTLNINIGNFSETGDVLIRNGQDDVEETEAGLIYYFSSDLEMMYDSWDFVPNVPNGFQKIGLRFQNVYIPQGAEISNAYIQFRSDEANSEFAEFLIFAENSGNAAPFDNGDLNVSARNTFPENVYWNPTLRPGPPQARLVLHKEPRNWVVCSNKSLTVTTGQQAIVLCSGLKEQE